MKNKLLFNKLKQLESPDATYEPQKYPIILKHGNGPYVWDVDGNKYIDFCAGFGALALGHNHNSLKKLFKKYSSISNNLVHGFSDIYASETKVKLLETIKQFLPKYLTKGAIVLSGSQAIEYALKTAMLASKKFGFICFKGGYHGLDFGALHCTYDPYFKKPFKKFLSHKNIIFCDYNSSIELLEQQIIAGYQKLENAKIGTAAIIVEPIQGRAGVIIPEQMWLRKLHELCKKLKIYLIFDEIYTGFGRCGIHSFAHILECDIVCYGKILGGGFPIAACFAKEDIINHWPKCNSEALHTGTFFGHPFCTHASLTFLKEYKKLQLHKKSKINGKLALTYLYKNLIELPIIKDVRGKGLMIAIEFKKPFIGIKIMEILKKNFNIIAIASGKKGESLTITPPLNIEWQILKKGCDKIIKCCKELISIKGA